jgi:transposase InsO family protein
VASDGPCSLCLQGVVRGKKVITTNPDAAQPGPDDKVNRAFVAERPNQLWVSGFTYVSSWQGMVLFGPYPQKWSRSSEQVVGVF